MKRTFLFSFYIALLSSSALADVFQNSHKYRGNYSNRNSALETPRPFKVIIAGGFAELNAGSSALSVTDSEIDQLMQTNKNRWDTGTLQLGIGYTHNFSWAFEHSVPFQWFSAIEPELNFYHLDGNIKGEVWRFGDPNFNTLNFDMPFRSSRLMLDLALRLATWQQFSIYGKAGIGVAWNKVSYSDKNKNAPCPLEDLSLNSNSNSNFAWEAGAGIIFNFNDRMGLSFEYLYADLGKVQPSSQGNTGGLTTPLISATSFNLNSQALLLGLQVTI